MKNAKPLPRDLSRFSKFYPCSPAVLREGVKDRFEYLNSAEMIAAKENKSHTE